MRTTRAARRSSSSNFLRDIVCHLALRVLLAPELWKSALISFKVKLDGEDL